MTARWVTLTALLWALGCASTESPDHGGDATSGSMGSGGDGTDGEATGAVGSSTSTGTTGSGGNGGSGGSGGEACSVNTLDLEVSRSAGVPYRIHVPVTYEGEPALFLLDTGSALTFLRLGQDDPDFVPDFAEATVGCQTLTLPGRGGLAPHPDEFGLPVVGTLGADFLIGGATLLDTREEKLVRRPHGDLPAETSAWPVLHYDDVQGHVLAPVLLDGVDVRLMLDTGSPDILWVGQPGQPGDQEVETTDAEGTLLTLYYGSVMLEMASRDVAEVPILRAPEFPYFEQTVEALGGNLHGLLGLSAFRGRALLFDGQAHEVRLGPVLH